MNSKSDQGKRKVQDDETGLYYFGARYYDPRTSAWQSADPMLDKYLPTSTDRTSSLPGMGGVYKPLNMGMYTYSHLNPVRFLDPDGNATLRFAEHITPQERKLVAANLEAVEKRIASQSTGESRARLLKFFDKWDVYYAGGGRSPSGSAAGITKGREGRSTLYRSGQDTLAHEFYHTVPENINRGNFAGLLGDPEKDLSEHGPFSSVDFARDLLSGKNVDNYSTGETVRPLPVELPRRSFWQMLKESFGFKKEPTPDATPRPRQEE